LLHHRARAGRLGYSSLEMSPKLTVRAVDRTTWSDFDKLFSAKGEELEHTDRKSRKRAMSRRVQRGTPIGLLGYVDSEPVAWCSIAPRSTYVRLISDGTPDDGVWSIACFFIARAHRKQGITKRMLAAAISHARKRGAKVVEATPVDEDSPSYRFMGFIPMFEEAGFTETGREGTRRHVMRKKLRPVRKKA
jgi:GNAT superfamily N-acetyltransferase